MAVTLLKDGIKDISPMISNVETRISSLESSLGSKVDATYDRIGSLKEDLDLHSTERTIQTEQINDGIITIGNGLTQFHRDIAADTAARNAEGRKYDDLAAKLDDTNALVVLLARRFKVCSSEDISRFSSNPLLLSTEGDSKSSGRKNNSTSSSAEQRRRPSGIQPPKSSTLRSSRGVAQGIVPKRAPATSDPARGKVRRQASAHIPILRAASGKENLRRSVLGRPPLQATTNKQPWI